MPTYVYDCPNCGQFETVQSIHDAPLKECTCGAPVKRNITFARLFTPEREKATYFAGSEGEERYELHRRHNEHIAEGIKSGTMADPKPGENQPVAMFKDLENRLKT